jgi:hypothetical protein
MSDHFLPPVKTGGALMDACPNVTKWSILFGPTDLSLSSMCFLEEITSDTGVAVRKFTHHCAASQHPLRDIKIGDKVTFDILKKFEE